MCTKGLRMESDKSGSQANVMSWVYVADLHETYSKFPKVDKTWLPGGFIPLCEGGPPEKSVSFPPVSTAQDINWWMG